MTRLLRALTAAPWVAPVLYAALVVGLVWFGVWRDRRNAEALGKAKADIVRLRADSLRAATAIHRVDSVFTRDTLTLRRTLTRYETLRDTLTLTDTLTVVRTLAAADTAMLACREAVESCTARVAARDTMIRVIGEQRQADQRLYAARLRMVNKRLTPYVEAAVNPFATATVTARAGVDLRVFGPLRLISAFQFTTAPSTSAALVGARVTF